MVGTDDQREVLDPVVGRLATIDGVRGIALGGSRARGRARPESDWDLGVFVDDGFSVESVRALALDAGWDGHVAELGEWGPVMNGGAWLEIEGRKVDLMWRELSTIGRVIDEAERGEFSVVRIPFFVAGMPSYLPMAELSFNRPVWGTVPGGRAMPDALRKRGSAWWRENATFDLDYAIGMTGRDEHAIAVGLLARTAVELAHSVLCDRGTWVLNEKGMLADAGLDAAAALVAGAGRDADAFEAATDELRRVLDP